MQRPQDQLWVHVSLWIQPSWQQTMWRYNIPNMHNRALITWNSQTSMWYCRFWCNILLVSFVSNWHVGVSCCSLIQILTSVPTLTPAVRSALTSKVVTNANVRKVTKLTQQQKPAKPSVNMICVPSKVFVDVKCVFCDIYILTFKKITTFILCLLWCYRNNSLSFLHQPSWSQKDDFGQKRVHQSYPTSKERCGPGYEHGNQRDILVRHVPKEDLQVSKVSVVTIRMKWVFLLHLLDASFSLLTQNSDGIGRRLYSAHRSDR